jgi:urea transporter
MPAAPRQKRFAVSLPGFVARGTTGLRTGVVNFLDILLRGYTPLILWNHPLVGVIFCLFLFLFDPWAAIAGLLGSGTATTVAIYVLKVDPGITRYGIFGINGFFTGLAWTAYMTATPALLPLLLFAAMLSALVTQGLFRLFSARLGLPVLILPFMIACWLTFPLARLFPWAEMGPFLRASPWWQSVEEGLGSWLPAILENFSRGLSELLFQNGLLVGLGIFALWLFRARLPALGALCVGLTAPAVLAFLGGPPPGSGLGVWAMTNGALTAFALGGTFLRPTISAFACALAGGVGAAWLTHAAFPLFVWLQVPIFVAPFVTVTLCFLALIHFPPGRVDLRRFGLVPVPLAEIGTPEEVLRLRRPPR